MDMWEHLYCVLVLVSIMTTLRTAHKTWALRLRTMRLKYRTYYFSGRGGGGDGVHRLFLARALMALVSR